MTAEDADSVIRQMISAFPSPTHLRTNPEGYQHALDVYRNALSRFDRETLQRGWQKAAAENDMWLWPRCSAIVAACEAVRPRGVPADAWVEKATELSDAYTRRFMRTSKQAVRAREHGYEAELKRYVRAASWVMGQMLLGRDGVAFDSTVLFAHCPNDKEAHEVFFAKCRAQAALGEIKVQPPQALVKAWQWEHGQGRGR